MPRLSFLLVLLLAACHARVDSHVEPAPPPPSGSGNVTIAMEGDWRVAVSVPLAPQVGEPVQSLGLTPPRTGAVIRIHGDLFEIADGEPLQPANMPDAEDWSVQNYVNLTTGKVAYYRLIREHDPSLPPLREEVGMVVGAVDEHRMLAFVQFVVSDTTTQSNGLYLVDLRR